MTGRPRKRPIADTLDIALQVFWAKGYASTSINDLSKALSIGPSSLYNAFGNKAGLYEACLLNYRSIYGAWLFEAVQEPRYADAMKQLLTRGIDAFTREGCPRGCAILNSSCADETDARVHSLLLDLRHQLIGLLSDRAQQAIRDGELPEDRMPEVEARRWLALLQGLSVQARDGASPQILLQTVQLVT